MALHSMIIYVWCRKNPHINLQFLFIPMKAPYFPYILMAFHYFSYGKYHRAPSLTVGFWTLISGHIYYYFSDILPKIAKVRGWKRTTFIEAPSFLHISIPFVTHRCWLLQGIGDEYDIEEPIPEELLTEELPEAAIAPDDESSSPEDEDEVHQRHSSVSYKHAQLKDELNAESNFVVAAVQVRRVHRQ